MNRKRTGKRVSPVVEEQGRWRNRYLGMRHGESVANVRGIIASRIETDSAVGAGLTDRGRRQVSAAALRSGLGVDVLLMCSDFVRARQSADIVAEVLRCGAPVADTRLQERNFGVFDSGSAENYSRVWNADARRELTPGVESVESVCSRVMDLLGEIEVKHCDRTVLLVAHGDTLQILQTVFAGIPAAEHRSLRPLLNAEIREFDPSC